MNIKVFTSEDCTKIKLLFHNLPKPLCVTYIAKVKDDLGVSSSAISFSTHTMQHERCVCALMLRQARRPVNFKVSTRRLIGKQARFVFDGVKLNRL